MTATMERTRFDGAAGEGFFDGLRIGSLCTGYGGLDAADLIVAKHRNGPTAIVTVAFQGHYSRFVDMAKEALPPPRAHRKPATTPASDQPWSPSGHAEDVS